MKIIKSALEERLVNPAQVIEFFLTHYSSGNSEVYYLRIGDINGVNTDLFKTDSPEKMAAVWDALQAWLSAEKPIGGAVFNLKEFEE